MRVTVYIPSPLLGTPGGPYPIIRGPNRRCACMTGRAGGMESPTMAAPQGDAMSAAAPTASREPRTPLTADQRNAFVAAFLGWTMDAFDYFLVVLVYAEIAKDFGVPLTQMAFLTTATLLMRPVGAFIFGLWADRVGRRTPLIVDVCFYSLCGFLCAFAPNFAVLLVLRLLYGIGMGGEWGLGAALAMEKIPTQRRGFFSGVLQEGYSVGYLLASVAFLLVTNVAGLSWRWLFGLSIIPALITLVIRARVRESEVWQTARERQRESRTPARAIYSLPAVCRRFVFLFVLMTAFNWMCYGCQDIYPPLLQDGLHIPCATRTWMVIGFYIGALLGRTVVGSLSERYGRRRMIILCAV